MKYAHMCIYVFDIIIVRISQASRNDLGSRFLTIEANDEENHSQNLSFFSFGMKIFILL